MQGKEQHKNKNQFNSLREKLSISCHSFTAIVFIDHQFDTTVSIYLSAIDRRSPPIEQLPYRERYRVGMEAFRVWISDYAFQFMKINWPACVGK